MKKIKTRKKVFAILRWIAWVLLIQFILINVMAALYAHKLTYFFDDAELKNANQSRNIFSKTWKLFTGPRYPKSQIREEPAFPYETVRFETSGGHVIEAWYSHTSDTVSAGAFILLHGIGGAKDNLLDEAEAFLDMGYHVLMLDFRAHGNSNGNKTYFGFRETEEVKLVYDYLIQKGHSKIFLFGSSMGAVTAMKAIQEYKLNVNGIIAEAPFASLVSHLKAKAVNLGFPSQPFAILTTFWIGVERGYNGWGYRTSKYAKKIHCPLLLQWGRQDAYVKEWETSCIYESVPSENKKLVIYEDGMHESLFRRDRTKWKTEVSNFLNAIR
jgi:alpha-beta hydrolase superfamily lysophospholipase